MTDTKRELTEKYGRRMTTGHGDSDIFFGAEAIDAAIQLGRAQIVAKVREVVATLKEECADPDYTMSEQYLLEDVADKLTAIIEDTK